jgi:hypothetical protein
MTLCFTPRRSHWWHELFVFALVGTASASGCRTQEAKSPEAEAEASDEAAFDDPDQEQSDGAGEEQADDTDAAGAEEDDGPSVQEKLALEAIGTQLARTTPEKEPDDSHSLEFAVVQQGPAQPWILGVVNRGEHYAQLVADPRLLSFEVSVPGKKQPVTCELPAPLRPTLAHARYRVWLGPGQGVVKAFDPRLYCFASSGQHVLVPGAIVTPKFGWPEKVKTSWKGGKKQLVPVEQTDPFVARVYATSEAPHAAAVTEPEAGPGAEEAQAAKVAKDAEAAEDAEADIAAAKVSIKGLKAAPIALSSEYQAWSAAAVQHPAKTRSPIAIDMQQGSDAASDLYAEVAIKLKNTSPHTQYVYFRRELLSFEVMGPGGTASCDPQPDVRAPDRQAFLQLSPGQSMSIPSRLVELCPKDTFARPGFYLVHARFESNETGEDYGIEAYVGRVATEHPANVRIRSGELSPYELEVMRPIQILE